MPCPHEIARPAADGLQAWLCWGQMHAMFWLLQGFGARCECWNPQQPIRNMHVHVTSLVRCVLQMAESKLLVQITVRNLISASWSSIQ
jgi:hypothetical protein